MNVALKQTSDTRPTIHARGEEARLAISELRDDLDRLYNGREPMNAKQYAEACESLHLAQEAVLEMQADATEVAESGAHAVAAPAEPPTPSVDLATLLTELQGARSHVEGAVLLLERAFGANVLGEDGAESTMDDTKARQELAQALVGFRRAFRLLKGHSPATGETTKADAQPTADRASLDMPTDIDLISATRYIDEQLGFARDGLDELLHLFEGPDRDKDRHTLIGVLDSLQEGRWKASQIGDARVRAWSDARKAAESTAARHAAE
jgi:hypothetical protein